ncbi:MAG: hypothetical protein AVDCRST_MAG93-58 [uncultured Chloroflexia bacterium]|uniref:Uncharacterized protein n=1 Tax=uncultured Chloroflexia bacterium TaxID=1672391 RepID=A0A6J4H2Z0_9CHLR|nr:MAG: hypothetical protein AVDCRST_MAG93-58 [uncultured Chloroflexia bacterium]
MLLRGRGRLLEVCTLQSNEVVSDHACSPSSLSHALKVRAKALFFV